MDKLQEAEMLYKNHKIEEALPLLKELAEENCGRAMYFLGEIYMNGFGPVRQDPEEAKRWREKGAACGDLLAKLNLAYFMEYGTQEMMEHCAACLEEARKLAESGDVFAQNEIADLYLFGFGTKRNEAEAIYWLEKSAAGGFWRPLMKLGDIYRGGEAVEEDMEKSVACYKKAAEFHVREAESSLGFIYFAGLGVEPDDRKAFAHFKKACEEGDGEASFMLGRFYMEGIAVKPDEKKGFQYFRQAADRGEPMGMWALGRSYESGTGVEIDEKNAFQWYEKGAAMLDFRSTCAVADCYRFGKGVAEDKEKAVEIYKNAFDLGSDEAADSLGAMYLVGETRHSEEEAFRWFEKGAGRGSDICQYHLGMCYDKGLGTEPDKEKALEYMYKAYDQGMLDALEYIKENMGIRLQ